MTWPLACPSDNCVPQLFWLSPTSGQVPISNAEYAYCVIPALPIILFKLCRQQPFLTVTEASSSHRIVCFLKLATENLLVWRFLIETDL